MHRSNFASTIRNTTLCTYKAYNNSGQTIALRIAFDSSTMKSLVRIMQTGSIPLYLIRLTTLPIYTVEGWDHCRLQKTWKEAVVPNCRYKPETLWDDLSKTIKKRDWFKIGLQVYVWNEDFQNTKPATRQPKGFSWLFPVNPGQLRGITSTGSRKPPSQSFPIHHPSIILPFDYKQR